MIARIEDVKREIGEAFNAAVTLANSLGPDEVADVVDSRERVFAALGELEAERDALKAENAQLIAKVNRMVKSAAIEDIRGEMSTATRERPILFSGPMVTAIREGRKTMTRRAVKGPIEFIGGKGDNRDDPSNWGWADEYGDWHTLAVGGDSSCDESCRIRCPYGQPGDRLWVRETFFIDDYRYPDASVPPAEFLKVIEYRAEHDCSSWEAGCPCSEGEWRPSIHMPRWASRLTLEITEVRVERLQEITEQDAIAEGFGAWTHRTEGTVAARQQFRDLWAKLNGKRPGCSWSANPWVWVVGFKLVEAPN